MGFLNLAMKGGIPGKPMNPNMPPQMPQGMGPMSNTEMGGLMGAFSGNPGFQDQLGAIMGGQGPGRMAPQFTPPQMPMNTMPPMGAAGGGLGRGMRPANPMGGPLSNMDMMALLQQRQQR